MPPDRYQIEISQMNGIRVMIVRVYLLVASLAVIVVVTAVLMVRR